MKKILVLNGANINMLGIREPEIYGNGTYEALVKLISSYANQKGIEAVFYQTNHEGVLVDKIHEAYGKFDALVFNPGGYTHTSVVLLDALRAVNLPTVEVHISDINAREDFRKVSMIRPACIGGICGHGFYGYCEAIDMLIDYFNKNES